MTTLGAAAIQAQTEKPVQIGIIGLGNRAGRHLAALKQLGDGKITALCDLDSTRIAAANQGLPAKAEAYTDYRELIKDRNVNTVVIATPGYLHHDMAIAALRAGKDVLMEKPLAFNYADALDVIREAQRSGRIIAVGTQRYYTREDVELRRAIEGGQIGKVRFITYQEYRGDWSPKTSLYTDPVTGKKTSWRLLAKTCGSSELEYSIHAFATVYSLVKSPLARLSATGGVAHYTDGREIHDIFSFIADFENGVRFNYAFSCFASGGVTNLVIVGDEAVLRREGNEIVRSTGHGKPQPLKNAADLPADMAEVQMYREFFRDVRERKQSPLRPEAALEPHKIAYATSMSIAERRIVTAKDFA
jgi:predicted dehydrogenase